MFIIISNNIKISIKCISVSVIFTFNGYMYPMPRKRWGDNARKRYINRQKVAFKKNI